MKLKTKDSNTSRKVASCYFTPTTTQEQLLWYFNTIESTIYNFFRALIITPKKGEPMNADQTWAYDILCKLIEIEQVKSNPPKSLGYMISIKEKFAEGKSASKPEMLALLGPLRNHKFEGFEFVSDLGALDLQKVVAKVHDNKGSFFGLKKAKDEKVRLMKNRVSTVLFKSIFFDGKSCEIVLKNDKCFLVVRRSPEGAPVLHIALPKYARFDKHSPEKNVLFADLAGSVSVVTIKRELEHVSEQSRFQLVLSYFSSAKKVQGEGNVGIELGVKFLTVISEEGLTKRFYLPQIADWSLKREQEIQSRADTCTVGSNAWRRRMKAKRAVAKRNHNVRKDNMRKVCAEIVTLFPAENYFIGEATIRGGLVTKETGTASQNARAHNTGFLSGIMHHLINLVGKERVISVTDPKIKGLSTEIRKEFGAWTILEAGKRKLLELEEVV